MATGPDAAASSTRLDFATEYAAFSSSLSVAAIAPEVVAAAKTNILDTLACAAAGFSATGVSDVVALVSDWAGKREASIWWTNTMIPAHHAALVNGMMAHARDYDDTHDAAVLHAGVSVVPAAMAAAQCDPDVTGADLVAGVVAGLELACRLGLATSIGIIDSGYMYTSLFGHFAATAAASRVLRLDKRATANALGIAYSQAAGNHQVTRDAALTKRIQPGFAAKTGLLSVALSQIGITGTRETFEGVDGLFRTYLKGNYDPARLREGLGKRFAFLDLSYKPYPCCRLNHTAIDAALELRDRLGGDLSMVQTIRCGVNRQTYQAVCLPIEVRRGPETIVEAQFSLPYGIASCLVNGRFGLAELSAEAIKDPAVRRLATMVEPYIDDDIEAGWSRTVSPARLSITIHDKIHSVFIETPLGHPRKPLTFEACSKKLADCFEASGLRFRPDAEIRLQAAIDGLAGVERAGDVVALMAGTNL